MRCHLVRPDQVGARGHGEGQGGGVTGDPGLGLLGRWPPSWGGGSSPSITAALLRLWVAAGASLHNSVSSSGWHAQCRGVQWSGLPHSLTRQPPATGLGCCAGLGLAALGQQCQPLHPSRPGLGCSLHHSGTAFPRTMTLAQHCRAVTPLSSTPPPHGDQHSTTTIIYLK